MLAPRSWSRLLQARRLVPTPVCSAQPAAGVRALSASQFEKFGVVHGGANAGPAVARTFEVWHGVVASGVVDKAGIERFRGVVADNCVFRPPTYFKPWEGGDETAVILACAAEVFGSSFAYRRQWLSDDGRDWALEFSAEIAQTGKRIDGIDLVHLDEDGRIVEFTVLARPPNAVAALKSEMVTRVPPRIAALKSRQALSSIASAFGLGGK